MKIAIISGSVRIGRSSHRVALFFKQFIEEQGLAEVEILDLASYNFPIFEERLKFQQKPHPAALEFSSKIQQADGVLIITPEYNGGYPAALKNVIDLLTSEWKRKPIAFSTVSSGSFGGTQVLEQIQFVLWKIGALTVPAMFPVPKVNDAFNEDGVPSDPESSHKRANAFIREFTHWIKTCQSNDSKE